MVVTELMATEMYLDAVPAFWKICVPAGKSPPGRKISQLDYLRERGVHAVNVA